jgi:hypothetical protein
MLLSFLQQVARYVQGITSIALKWKGIERRMMACRRAAPDYSSMSLPAGNNDICLIQQL